MGYGAPLSYHPLREGETLPPYPPPPILEMDLSKAPSLVEFGDGVFHGVFRGDAS